MAPGLTASVALAGFGAWKARDLTVGDLGQGVPEALVRTETFTVLAMCQWFNVLNCQSARASALGLRILRNRWLLGGLSLSVLLQALVLYALPMNALFHTVPLPLASLLPLLGLASVVLLRSGFTADDAEDQALLKRFGIYGPPTFAFCSADSNERRNFRVVSYMKAGEFAPLAARATE